MYDKKMYELGAQPSAIRELARFGAERKAEIGADKVFDFSIGNPSVPTPPQVMESISKLALDSSCDVHGYTSNRGLDSARAAIAENLNMRFGTNYECDNLYLSCGAASSLRIALKALCAPGDEVIIIAPYFPEYSVFIEDQGCTCVEVPAREGDFQIDCDALYEAITEKTSMVIINSPNNPVGVVYSQNNLEQLAATLRAAELEFGQPIYLLSDEPYRELIFETNSIPWIPNIYENTLVCYSWSKCFSIPGDRLGYLLIPSEVDDAEEVIAAVYGAGRGMGYVCAPALLQHMICECAGVMPNIEPYRENRDLLCKIMDEVGLKYIYPQGAFYLWVKSPIPDAKEFSLKARDFELLIVPSDSFGVSGWIRIGYCTDKDTIIKSKDAFAELMKCYK